MKNSIFDKSGMKQIINSGWKEFDKQTNCITTGNAYCNTQVSSFIRPYNETKCNGHSFPKGNLLNFDLKQFQKFQIPGSILKILRNLEREESVILYMFFVHNRGRVKPFCWIITNTNHKLIDSCLVCDYKQNYEKRLSAEREILSYITL